MRCIPVLLLLASAVAANAAPRAEILWDKYGVPHIFAGSIEDMFYAHGWAQMQNHADLLLRLYGESRGRGAEYWGEDKLSLDRWVRANNVPELANQWYQAQNPQFRRNLDAFARGINDFAKAHPNHTSPAYRVVLPVSGVDVVGHTLRAVHFMYMGSQARMKNEVGRLIKSKQLASIASDPNLAEPLAAAGSNTWAVGPSRSASGKAMLIINPHLIWEDFYSYMEVHLTAPGYDLYGAPQIGFPVPVIGFNRHTGWGRTVNTIDTVDFYRLTVRNSNAYEFDGALKDFQRETKTIKVKQPNGTMREEKLEVRRSVHGPVVFDEQGVTVAMRVAGLDRPKMLEQWFRMGGARNLEEFKDAMRMVSVPMWHANYAGADGHLMLLFNGVIPKRGMGDWSYWSGVVPGDTSKTLWTSYHTFEELPKSIDPPAGFNQNANEPPWYFTIPQLDPKQFPPYMAPGPEKLTSFRTTRSLRMISEDKSITYDELLDYKHSTRMELADAILPDLLAASKASADPLIQEAAAVLEKWDRCADINSRGGVLFELYADRGIGTGDGLNDVFKVKYDYRRPLDTAKGLANPQAALVALKQAAEECKRLYGALDVPWGDVHRYRRGNLDIPANGAHGRLGVFRTMQFAHKANNRLYASHGETFVCAIEFGAPQKAQCLLGYGNASQPGSKHIEDQLPLMQQKKLHPVWRERAEIEANFESRETLIR